MSSVPISFHLRPARNAEDARVRAHIVARLRSQREEIELFLNGVAHYNDTHPDETPIDADPDGNIAAIKRALDESLMNERSDEGPAPRRHPAGENDIQMSANIAIPDSPAGAGSSPSPLFGVWRPVAEYDIRVTDYHPRVLVWDGNRHWTGRYWEEDGKFHCDECMKIAATHWMLLPDPPNVSDQATASGKL